MILTICAIKSLKNRASLNLNLNHKPLELILPPRIFPYGAPLASGILKASAEDFKVDEVLGFEPSGSGEHLLLQIEKKDVTTTDLVDILAGDYGLHPKHIGYCGLKDKRAVTRQWFSLQLPGKMDSTEIPPSDLYQVCQSGWHHRKLKRGSHQANRFEVRIREVSDWTEISQEQVQSVIRAGMANYFGTQRFGQQQDNVDRGLAALSSPRKRKRLTRNKRGIYLSALRAHLFNAILSERINRGDWANPINGDVFMLRGSHSIFTAAIDQTMIDRFQSMDISSTASLPGKSATELTADAQLLEESIFARFSEVRACLLEQDIETQLRAIRMPIDWLEIDYDAEQTCLTVKAELSSGCYMTTLLDHFINTNQI
ncbi:MAG: tRNA pseudouridine13 synthase [Gammaproteobacteria bacterium]